MANIGKGRILRVCEMCGGVDDHPRQLLTGTDGAEIIPEPTPELIDKVLDQAPPADRGRLLADLMDRSSASLHYDCCKSTGCSHPECAQIVAAADGKTGKALLALLAGANDPIEYTADTVKGE